MKIRRIEILLGICLLIFVMGLKAGMAADSIGRERLELASRLQAMSHGYFTQAEWDRALSDLNELIGKAGRRGAHEELIELRVLEAVVYGNMLSDHQRALDILKKTLSAYQDQPYHNVRRIYVQLAEIHARRGDDAAIGALIEEFRASRHYDPQAYAYEGGWGREVPLAVTRPRVGGSESITVTTMLKYQQQARFAPGRLLPDFSGVDIHGNPVRLSDFRGQVVLVDFYVPEWLVWRRDLPNVKNAYQRYHPDGFEIIGIFMGRDVDAWRRFLREQRISWPQIAGNRSIPAQYGIFGEARNFLLNQNGVIVGRDLRGADLAEMIRQTL